jgi:hypothetical protein
MYAHVLVLSVGKERANEKGHMRAGERYESDTSAPVVLGGHARDDDVRLADECLLCIVRLPPPQPPPPPTPR